MPFGKAFDKFEEKKERDEENEKLTEEKDFGEGDVIFKYYKQSKYLMKVVLNKVNI